MLLVWLYGTLRMYAAGQVLKSKGKSARWIAVLELIRCRAREAGSEQLGRWYRRAVSIGAVVV